MAHWIWRHFAIDVPDDWEMLQFSRDLETGTCHFADRYRFRLEFNWRRVPGQPDFDRLISDYVAKLKDQQGMKDARETRAGDWRGIEGHLGEVMTTRFGAHFPGEACLIEVVLIWPGDRDAGLERAILASIQEQPPREDGFRRWRAFGMDLLASNDTVLANCTIKPAYGQMTFSSRTSWGRKEVFQRLGMVKYWLKGTVEAWLALQVGPGVKVRSRSTHEHARHTIHTLSGEKMAKRFPRLRAARLAYAAAGWICPADERLYHVACLEPDVKKTEGIALAGNRLSCCKDRGLRQ